MVVALLTEEASLEVRLESAFSFLTRLPIVPPMTAIIMIAAIRATRRKMADLRKACGRVFVFRDGAASCCKALLGGSG